MLVFTLWQSFQVQKRGETELQSPAQVEQGVDGQVDSGSADEFAAGAPLRPVPRTDGSVTTAQPETLPEAREGDTPRDLAESVSVFEGEFFHAELTSRGGALQTWRLNDYVQWLGNGERPNIDLVRVDAATQSIFRTPFTELGLGDLGEQVFEVVHQSNDEIEFLLRRGDIAIRKRYEFDLSSYEFKLEVTVENESSGPLATKFEIRLPSKFVADELDFSEASLAVRNMESVERATVANAGDPGFFSRLFGSGGDGPIIHRGSVDWIALDLKDFVAALLPADRGEASVLFKTLEAGVSSAAILDFETVNVPPGGSHTREFNSYIGPKVVARLDAVGSGLVDAINLGYSWLAPLTRFFRWLLPAVYSWVGNYGLAIIVITVAVRLLTAPIMAKQMKSMERMRELQPRMKEIQEQHKDDRQKQSEETMKMYKETGTNPLSGCFPMLLQFPVFIGLFFALQSSIELRQASFVGWINDLSSPEALLTIPGLDLPIRLLPIVMGASMVIQQRMTPQTTMDPAQAKMMMTVMPVMMTVLFYQFPSGLVLYWMVSNLLGIAHQLWVRKNMEKQKQKQS
jgi:YidC/Oxa1 family membrane protein insertase